MNRLSTFRSPALAALASCCSLAGLCAQDPAPTPAPTPSEPRLARVYDLARTAPALAALPMPRADRDPLFADDGVAAVAQFVRAFVQPPLRSDEQVQTLGEHWLVLLGREAQHHWLDRFLAQDRHLGPELLELRTEWLVLPEVTWQQHVAPALVRDGVPAGELTILAPDAATAAFVAELRRLGADKRVSLGTVIARPLVPAHCAWVAQQSYVGDFDVEIANGCVVADPIVRIAQEGVSVSAVATRLDGNRIGLSLSVHVTDLLRPIPTIATNLGAGADVQLQVPTVQRASVTAAVEATLPSTLVIALPQLGGQRNVALIELAPPPAAK